MKKLLVAVSLMFASAAWANDFLDSQWTLDYQDGMRASSDGNYTVALAKFRLAAAQGETGAQFNLGVDLVKKVDI